MSALAPSLMAVNKGTYRTVPCTDCWERARQLVNRRGRHPTLDDLPLADPLRALAERLVLSAYSAMHLARDLDQGVSPRTIGAISVAELREEDAGLLAQVGGIAWRLRGLADFFEKISAGIAPALAAVRDATPLDPAA